jgi:hypothetical protein
MRNLVIYLNELSCCFEGHSLDSIRLHVVNTIATVRKVSEQREDTILRMHCRLADLTFGTQHLLLAAILPGPNDRFTQFKRLLDKAPCGPVTNLDSEVRYGEQIPIGLRWADKDGTFVFSFGHSESWLCQTISCQRHSLYESGEITVTSIAVGNLAIPAHVDVWKNRLHDYGNDPAKSSLLYEGTGFVMRMHLHDHEPPHLHIYPRRGDTGNRIARVCIDNCDLLDGSLSSAMDHEITDVITRYRKTLLEGWQAIKTGKPPLKLC